MHNNKDKKRNKLRLFSYQNILVFSSTVVDCYTFFYTLSSLTNDYFFSFRLGAFIECKGSYKLAKMQLHCTYYNAFPIMELWIFLADMHAISHIFFLLFPDSVVVLLSHVLFSIVAFVISICFPCVLTVSRLCHLLAGLHHDLPRLLVRGRHSILLRHGLLGQL